MSAFSTTHKIKVSNLGGILQPSAPITLKNQIQEINSIRDIRDVTSLDVTSGSTLIYNQTNNKFEIRHLATADFSGTLNVDGGSF